MSTTDYVYMFMKYVVWKKMDSKRSDQTLNMYRFSELSMLLTVPFFNCYCAIIKAFEKGTGSKIVSLEAWIKM